jgi:hypothetical protein
MCVRVGGNDLTLWDGFKGKRVGCVLKVGGYGSTDYNFVLLKVQRGGRVFGV